MIRALISGITGQDGAYLAKFLLSKGCYVHGIKRRACSFNTGRIDHLYTDPHKEGVRFLALATLSANHPNKTNPTNKTFLLPL